MKKLMVFVLALVCVSFLFGCNKGAENTNVPFETDMTKKTDHGATEDGFTSESYHDLGTDGAMTLSGSVENGDIFIAPDALYTNTTKISVTNNNDAEITAYLYSANDTDNAIQEMKVDAGKTKAFTGLTSRFLYYIGMATEDDTEINIMVED